MIFDSARRSGRTTRMLQHAVDLSNAGRAVYVLTGDKSQAGTIASMLHDMGYDDDALCRMGIKIETPSSLPRFDYERMCLPGAHPNCVVLVDHYAIARRFWLLLKMYHAYDVPERRQE